MNHDISNAIRDWLKAEDISPADVESFTIDREKIVLKLYARSSGGSRIRDDEFGDYVTFHRHYEIDTTNLWWM